MHQSSPVVRTSKTQHHRAGPLFLLLLSQSLLPAAAAAPFLFFWGLIWIAFLIVCMIETKRDNNCIIIRRFSPIILH
jgi:hypothetical protein